MKTSLTILAACLLAAVSRPVVARAQTGVVGFGVYAVRASDLFDGATGVGAEIAINAPGLPLTLRGAVDRFFPDCPEGSSGGATDCGAWGFSVDANAGLSVPVLRPYLSAGWVRRSIDLGDPLMKTDQVRKGVAVGGGIQLELGRFGAFGEARYEFRQGPGDEWVYRLGVVF